MKIKLIALNAQYAHSGLALFYVRNELLAHLPERDITLQQFTINDPYYQTLLHIVAGEPQAIFFSVYVWNALIIKRLILDLKKVLPKVVIVVGGPETTCWEVGGLPERCVVVRGEIEGVGQRFFHDLQTGSLQPEYIAESGNPFSFPYREEDFTSHLKNRVIYYESSRGCPFSCSYCLSSAEKGMNVKDAEEVKKELAILLRNSPGVIKFIDRSFNFQSERALEIWRYVAEAGLKTVFQFEIMPDLISEDMFTFLKKLEPGRFRFEVGIQSTNAESLRVINRKTDSSKALENIARLAKLDTIHIHVDLILGLPFETTQSFRKTFNDVFVGFPHYIQMGLLKVLPGTKLAEQSREYGLSHCGGPPYEIVSTKWMRHNDLARLFWLGEVVEKVYNNRFFRALLNYLSSTEKDPFAYFERFLAGLISKALPQSQEQLFRLIYDCTAERKDNNLIVELLRYDWLRSGKRGLPVFLAYEGFSELKSEIKKKLPQSMEPFFNYKTRNVFFKHADFCRFSQEALVEIGVVDEKHQGDGVVCFLPETVQGVFSLRKILVLSIPG